MDRTSKPRNTPCNHLSKWLQPTLQPPRPSCIRHASGRHFDRKSIAQSPHTKFFRDPSPKITNIPNDHLNFLCGNPCRTNILDRSLQIYPRWLSMHQGCLEDICSNKKEWMTALISEHLVCKICVWSREILQSSHIYVRMATAMTKKHDLRVGGGPFEWDFNKQVINMAPSCRSKLKTLKEPTSQSMSKQQRSILALLQLIGLEQNLCPFLLFLPFYLRSWSTRTNCNKYGKQALAPAVDRHTTF